MAKFWVAVASAEHVEIGYALGFMQVCHGKPGPLKRLRDGDGVVYYSPSHVMRRRDGLQSFTALGIVRDFTKQGAKNDPVYQASMNGSLFRPFRRDVDWIVDNKTAIRPLLASLEFTHKNPNWGYQLRLGIFEISSHDFEIISDAMNAAKSIPFERTNVVQPDLFAT